MKKKVTAVVVVIIAFISVVFIYFKSEENKLPGVKIIDMKSGGKHLLFYGSRHSNDKTDPMFEDIEKKFLSMNPQVVLVEGDMNNTRYNDIDAAIKNGESSFVSYLAQENNIPLQSVEPPMRDQYQHLLGKFDKTRVLLMYILRQVQQYQRELDNKPIVFTEELQRLVNGMVRTGFPLDEDETKIDNVMGVLSSYLNQNIDNSNWKNIDTKKYVFRNSADLYGIYKEVYKFRNKYLISTIENKLEKYDRVFVIMGNGHVEDEKEHVTEVFKRVTE